MKIRFFLLSMAFFIVTGLYSQTNLNNYKYIIVPKRYDFLKEENQYRLNELTVFLFNKYGFSPLMEGDKYPDELLKNRCLALESDVNKDGGMFKTKLNIALKDCNDIVIYTTAFGESREKEYQKAYTEALRGAFKSFETLNYKFEPSEKQLAVKSQPTETSGDAVVKQEIEQLKAELEALKQTKEEEITTETKALTSAVKSVKEKKTEVVTAVKTPAKKEVETKQVPVEVNTDILYAQAIENGYQLVDSSPKVIYRILKTGIENVFLVENLNATIQKKVDQWILEYYEDGYLKQDVLNIKF